MAERMIKRKLGKPTKLQPELKERLLRLIRGGSYRNAACAAVGISERVLYQWEQYAREGREPYASFCDELAVVEADGETQLAMLIGASARGKAPLGADWRAAGFLLERRFRRRWAQQQQVELTGAEGQPVQIQAVTPARARELIEEQFSRVKPPMLAEIDESDLLGVEDPTNGATNGSGENGATKH